MMRSPDALQSSKITATHQAKLAYVYIRQSSLSQVNRHAESTEMQYRLVDRANELGWPSERVVVIDEDLGKSGASTAQRTGFQGLMAEIGLAHVGLVLSFDASRLARNNHDWHQLLELCSLFGALIADSQSVYDPRRYQDRLLLGLSGLMSEAELHQIKLRMHTGRWQKAERGDLKLRLPVGLVRLTTNEVVFNPDEEIQGRIRLVLGQFRQLGTAGAVARYLHHHQLRIPVRPLSGPEPHEVLWRPATRERVLEILKNPAYAGAYAYGQSQYDPTRRRPGHPYSGLIRLPVDEWPVLLHDRYPAYISWSEFLKNLAQLEANVSNQKQGKPGAPKKGTALLQGIAICGCCAGQMHVHYSGPKGDFPVYRCSYVRQHSAGRYCQEVRALGLDAEVEQIILSAIEPDKMAIALQAFAELEQEKRALHKQWQLRLERVRYEAARAQRQYNQVEPENRLVARTLENHWEEKLRLVEKTEREYQAWQGQQQATVTEADRAEILALAQDIPRLWHAATTTPQDRKRILRLLIRDVILDQTRVQGKVWFQINWQTGAISEHWYQRRVGNYADHADLATIERWIRQLHGQQKLDDEIAAVLNKKGLRTAKLKPFSSDAVRILRKRMGLPAQISKGANPRRWPDGTYSAQGAAELFDVTPDTIYQWIRAGRLDASQLRKGTPWKIILSPDNIESLQAYLCHIRRPKREAL